MLEFAFSSFALVALLVAIVEFAMLMFAWSLLETGIREAARYGFTGQDSPADRQTQISNIIVERSMGVIEVTVDQIETRVFGSFAEIGVPETFTDGNGNGTFDSGESFTDTNGNGVRDDGTGTAGVGGASEVVQYKVEARWLAFSPLMGGVFGERGVPLSSSIVVRNEPWPE